jgi:putative endopeptidase
MKRLLLILIVVLGILSAGCTSPAGTAAPAAATHQADNDSALNLSVSPGNNFYAYVNDAWDEDHPIPADKSRYTTFDALGDTVDDNLHALFANAANAAPGSTDKNITLLGQFYRSGMDNATRDREGITPLAGDLAAIDAIRSRSDLKNVTIVLLGRGYSPVYQYGTEINPKNSSEMIAAFEQGGTGLPDRDYYLRTDNRSREIQDAYTHHIETVFVLAGETDAQAAADAATVYAMETKLAKAQYSPEENMDPEKTTNFYTPAELEARYPAIGWDQLATLPGEGQVTRVDLHQPRYAQGLDSLMETAPLDDWKVFLRYRVLDSMSPYLSQGFVNENFDFYSKTLSGTPTMMPRWKQVVRTENAALGDLAGKAYVDAYVDPRTRGMVSEMFVNLRQAFDRRIANLTWMSATTKAAAREKLAAMGQKIAYPDAWMDYSGLTLSDSYAENARAASAYLFVHGPYGIGQAGKPVDRTVWSMEPQTVNAYYDPTRNEMVFPAAILQKPFFDPDADAAQNYGAIGWVIGHEMTHGFDSVGRQYDKNGNLNNWWTDDDSRRFNTNTALLVQEYNTFEALPGLPVNGNLTLTENIADFGGISIAHDAWKAQENQTLDAAADRLKEREFFISAARIWRGNYRDEMIRLQTNSNTHSINTYRVNGVFFNVPQFYDAFPEIRPGDALYRNVSDRPVIW